MKYLKLIDFFGKELWSFSKDITASKGSSELMHKLNLEGIDKKNAVLVSSFNHTTSIFYLTNTKDLQLQQAEITQEITQSKIVLMVQKLSLVATCCSC